MEGRTPYKAPAIRVLGVVCDQSTDSQAARAVGNPVRIPGTHTRMAEGTKNPRWMQIGSAESPSWLPPVLSSRAMCGLAARDCH